MKKEKTPTFKEVIPRKEFYTKNDLTDRRFLEIMEKGGVSIEGVNITPIDFFYVPESIEDEELLEAAAKYLSFEGGLKKMKSKEFFCEINEKLDYARNYLKNYLHLGTLPREIDELEIKNEKDIISMLKKSTALKNKDKLGYAPCYCALLKILAVSFEYDNNRFRDFIDESEYLMERILQPREQEEKEGPVYTKIREVDNKWLRIGIKERNFWMQASMSYRGKEQEVTIGKLLNKPEIDINKIINDGIGLRIEVDSRNNAVLAILSIVNYLKEKFNLNDIIYKNVNNFFDERDERYGSFTKVMEYFGAIVKRDEINESSNNFEAAYVKGRVDVPVKGKEGNLIQDRSIEIQIVLDTNKNEEGFRRHEIYKAVQKVSILSRLFGSISEEKIDLICEEAHGETNFSKEKIKKYILEKYLVEIYPKGRGLKKRMYCTKAHVKRWIKAGLWSKELGAKGMAETKTKRAKNKS